MLEVPDVHGLDFHLYGLHKIFTPFKLRLKGVFHKKNMKFICIAIFIFFLFPRTFSQCRIVGINNEPLPFATISIKNNGLLIEADEKGMFIVPDFVKIGGVNLEISYVGHNKLDTILEIVSNYCILKLMPFDTLGIINILGIRPIKRQSTSIIPLSKIKNSTSLLGEPDIFKTIQNLPGVNFGIEGTSDFVVRGGNVGENQILLDGMPVYLSSHLFGLVSPINYYLVDEVQFYKNGFPAEYSGKLSSITDIKTLKIIEKNSKNLTLGVLSSSFSLKHNITEKLSIAFSARASILDKLIGLYNFSFEPKTQVNSGFYDVFIKANYKINPFSTMTISGFNTSDKFNNKFENKLPNELFYDSNLIKWKNNYLHFSYLYQKRNLNFQINYSYTDYAFSFYSEFKQFSQFDSIVSVEDYSTFNADHNINSKVRFKISNFLSTQHGIRLNDRKINLAETSHVNESDRINQELLLSNFYSSLNLENKYTSSFLGINILSLPMNGFKTFFEPRLYLDYRWHSNKIYASFSVIKQTDHLISNRSIGNYLKIWILPEFEKYSFASSRDYSLGYSFGSNNTVYNLELYYKLRSRLIHPKEGDRIFITSDNINNLEADGKGEAYGLELSHLFRKRKHEFDTNLSISKSTLLFNNINQGNTFDDYFDRRISLKCTYNYYLNEKWTINSFFIFMSGTPFTAVNSAYPSHAYSSIDRELNLSSIPNNILFYYNEVNNLRLPYYHRLDINAKHERIKNNSKRTISFGVYNIYARNNPLLLRITQKFVPEGNTIVAAGSKYEIVSYFNFIPNISYNIEF